MWQPLVMEELFKNNEFLKFAHNADEYVIGGRAVHIPQSGGPSGVERNRAVLPATIVTRGDTVITYALDTYTTNPTRIDNADKVELSYNKTTSIINENTGEMMELVGDDMLQKWADDMPAASIILSTGADATAEAPGATGTRKIITEADLRKAQTLMNNQNVPRADRYAILTNTQIGQLLSDDDVKKYTQIVADLKQGKMVKLYGFNIIERSSVVRLAADDSAKLPEAANSIDDDVAGLLFQKNAVERALGDVTMFDEYGRPEYYGDIFSFLVRASGRRRRADNKGVFLLRNAA